MCITLGFEFVQISLVPAVLAEDIERISDVLKKLPVLGRRFLQGCKQSRIRSFHIDFLFESDELDRLKLIPVAIAILAGIVYATWKTGLWLLATIAVIAAIIAACYKISKALTNRSLNAEIKPVQEKVDKLKSDCDKIAVQNKELMEHYKELTQKIVAADTEYLKATSADDTDEDDLTGSEDTSAED